MVARSSPLSPTLIEIGRHPTGRGAAAVAVADLDGDARLDAAVANAAATVDANGTLDVLTANLRGGDVTVLLGDGQGGFRPAPGSPFAAGDAPFAVAAGDFDGDGAADLAVASSASNSTGRGRDGLILLRGDGRGGLAPFGGSVRPLPTGAAPVAVAACDLDGDGRAEAITADYNGGSVTTASWREPGAVTRTVPVGRQPEGIACGDLDGDGREEVLVVVLGGDDALVILRAVEGHEGRIE